MIAILLAAASLSTILLIYRLVRGTLTDLYLKLNTAFCLICVAAAGLLTLLTPEPFEIQDKITIQIPPYYYCTNSSTKMETPLPYYCFIIVKGDRAKLLLVSQDDYFSFQVGDEFKISPIHCHYFS